MSLLLLLLFIINRSFHRHQINYTGYGIEYSQELPKMFAYSRSAL